MQIKLKAVAYCITQRTDPSWLERSQDLGVQGRRRKARLVLLQAAPGWCPQGSLRARHERCDQPAKERPEDARRVQEARGEVYLSSRLSLGDARNESYDNFYLVIRTIYLLRMPVLVYV